MSLEQLQSSANYITPEVLEVLNKANNIDVSSLTRHRKDRVVFKGVYFLFNYLDELVYIGSTNDIYNRLNFHFKEEKKDYKTYSFIEFKDDEYKIVERFLINKFLPKYNKDIVTKKIKSL